MSETAQPPHIAFGTRVRTLAILRGDAAIRLQEL